MKINNRVIYALLLLVVGFAGYYFGKINNQQTNTIIKPIEKTICVQPQPKVKDNKPKTVIIKKVKQKIANKSYQKIKEKNPYLLEYIPSQEAFNKIVDNLSALELDDYFNKLVAKDDDDFNQIYDKYTFVKSLMREFAEENDNSNIDTNSTIKFSLSSKPNTAGITNFKLSNSRKTIYAHLQLDKDITMISDTFIKWSNLDNGRILLYEKKNINPITRQNWVSFTPNKNWHTGNYQVTFYQFNSELKPIVQGNYYIE